MATESSIFPVAGYSHKPEEYASPEDMTNGVKVLALTMAKLSLEWQVSMRGNQVAPPNNTCVLANNKLHNSGVIFPAPGLYWHHHL